MFSGAELLLLLVLALTFLLAGFVKGAIGLGLPTIAMGLLSTIMAPVEAASLLIVPSLVTNVWQLAAGPHLGPLLRRLWPMLLAVALGTLAGTGFMEGQQASYTTIGLGIALLVYAVLGLSSVRVSVAAQTEVWLGPVVGTITGLVTAGTGVFVIPVVPYLAALSLIKEDLVQALGLSFTVSTIALGTSLALSGSLQLGSLNYSLLALAPALLGLILGSRVQNRVSERVFRRCFYIALLGLGSYLLWQATL